MSRYDDLLAFEFPVFEQQYDVRDTLLYALGVGAGGDPVDPEELAFAYEKDLTAIPSMAVTLAYPGFWYRDLRPGLDFVRTVHASERFEIHRPLPVAASVWARPRIVAIHDKGEGRGALVVSQREIRNRADDGLVATVTQTAFCRGDGGLGGPIVPAPAPHALPDRAPDHVEDMAIASQAALIYRLSGDYNPLHVDPDFAAQAGFARPILHGLSTYGHVCRLIEKLARRRGLTIAMMDCRFTGPVFPGEAIRVELWDGGDLVAFRATVAGRKAIDNGTCRLTAVGLHA